MHPLKQLKRLLQPTRTNQGLIVAQNADNLILATPQGSVSAKRSMNDLTNYRVGDTVLLSNGVILGKRHRQPKIYVL